MTTDDTMQLIYYAVLLIAVGGAIIVEMFGRGGKGLKQALIWVVIFAGVAVAYDMWTGGDLGRQRVVDGRRIEIAAASDGHFNLVAELNGQEVPFMVDTGASMIALTQDDARSIGIDPARLDYLGSAMTANGEIRTAPVLIDEFAIGDIVDQNVRAWVVEGDLDQSLLGMSYLRNFARVSFEGDQMVLER